MISMWASIDVNHKVLDSTMWDSSIIRMQPDIDWRTADVFDIEYFEKHNEGWEMHMSTKNWWKVKRRKPSTLELYIQEAISPDGSRTTYKEYNTKNGLLKTFWSFLYGFKVDQWSYYDDSGVLISRSDENAAYPYTLQQLDTRLKEKWIYTMESHSGESGVHTNNTTWAFLYRDNVDGIGPRYYIHYPVSSSSIYPLHAIILDGNNWAIIKEEVLEYTK